MSALDPAVLRALNLPRGTKADATSHGGSGFTSTQKLTITRSEGAIQRFFLKTAQGPAAAVMFAGEHASLAALHGAVPSLCPASYGAGRLEEQPDVHFLVTEFLELGGRRSTGGGRGGKGGDDDEEEERGSGLSLAAKLGRLHATPAPVPEGRERPMFGFPVTTCCGDTPQPNEYRASWAEFYAEQRLRAVLARAERTHGRDGDLRSMVERTADVVVPRLLRDGHLGGKKGIVPVVVHGDLWSGNRGTGRIGGRGGVEEVVFDPSSCYAHGEFELGIMRMFGGFEGSFMREYHAIVPKTEPTAEYEDRVSLYELYHHLNHTAIFGGSYRHGAMSIMKGLWKKYGDGT